MFIYLLKQFVNRGVCLNMSQIFLEVESKALCNIYVFKRGISKLEKNLTRIWETKWFQFLSSLLIQRVWSSIRFITLVKFENKNFHWFDLGLNKHFVVWEALTFFGEMGLFKNVGLKVIKGFSAPCWDFIVFWRKQYSDELLTCFIPRVMYRYNKFRGICFLRNGTVFNCVVLSTQAYFDSFPCVLFLNLNASFFQEICCNILFIGLYRYVLSFLKFKLVIEGDILASCSGNGIVMLHDTHQIKMSLRCVQVVLNHVFITFLVDHS